MTHEAGTPHRRASRPEQLASMAALFQSLSDPTRLRLLDLLHQRSDQTQRDLIAATGATQSRVSDHLGWLRWSGLVDARRDGRSTRYRLAEGKVTALLDIAAAHVTETGAPPVAVEQP